MLVQTTSVGCVGVHGNVLDREGQKQRVSIGRYRLPQRGGRGVECDTWKRNVTIGSFAWERALFFFH